LPFQAKLLAALCDWKDCIKVCQLVPEASDNRRSRSQLNLSAGVIVMQAEAKEEIAFKLKTAGVDEHGIHACRSG